MSCGELSLCVLSANTIEKQRERLDLPPGMLVQHELSDITSNFTSIEDPTSR